MKNGEATAQALCSQQRGVVARDQLAIAGVGSNSITALCRSGRFELVTSRVLRSLASPPVRGQRAQIAVLDAGDGAVLSHKGAASWWGASGFDLRDLELTPLGHSRRTTNLAKVHQVRGLPDRWTTQHQGIPIVRPELCVLHLCATLPAGRAERALDNIWRLRLLSGRSLVAFVADYGAKGRNCTRLLRQLIDARGDELWCGRVDRRAPDVPFIVEIQSWMYHPSLIDRAADHHRIAALRAGGFVVTEIKDSTVWQHPSEVVRAVRDGRRAAAKIA
jgi:hypothetical protein